MNYDKEIEELKTTVKSMQLDIKKLRNLMRAFFQKMTTLDDETENPPEEENCKKRNVSFKVNNSSRSIAFGTK
jgi:phage shock protein A